MPTIFSHAVFAAVTGKSFFKKPVSFWFWALTAGCAMIPDADVAFRYFGFKQGALLSHRGFTHSRFFAVLFGTLVALFVDKRLRTGLTLPRLAVFFSLATFSHPVLDMLTNGGSGVALLAPFSDERFFFPWRPVEVSPIGLRFFGPRGLEVMTSEIIWIWLPALAIFLLSKVLFNRKKAPRQKGRKAK
jgi:inner membrane protein